ncbi:hypothetical protein ZIOFF_062444 [Zingiber officinale]|uniref:DUF6821 domain-containing protein n=1 Tax=Zingiber officinale TaxID=94328 RepID=A0A8J5KFD0_ZINOF|nr:hypothetical protein ZIOFF_062444 [Zingiber officinale]
MAAQFEIRQRNLKVARQILGNAIGMAPKDKKASQLKVHATRLNEAFSMIRRAPIIRPSLTSGGLTPWSVVSLQ